MRGRLSYLLVHLFASYSFAQIVLIKPSPPAVPNPFGFPDRSSFQMAADGKIDATRVTLFDLILRAYDLQPFQVTGGPKWITSERFDITTRPEPGFSGGTPQIQAMLRQVLAERFNLRAHTETRELPVYHLVFARSDGKLGPQLRPSTLDCAAVRAKQSADDATCRPSFHADVKAGTMTIQVQGESMAELARLLTSPDTQRAVLDKTDRAGTFDAEYTFAPEPLPGFPRMPNSDGGLSLFTALREQLGLKLEPDRGPVQVLVIESAELPNEN